ncbi:hypothetical protein Msi02_82500 [Microbispora siamensis]|uniref:Uncharacterized protein n=1 Tax=Microbispora siamensis TaxID=564413 RepID=A0ABQ4H178_9ACTN|nr:hypothetical protein Msi02_82500 [Microbispora siamensis]
MGSPGVSLRVTFWKADSGGAGLSCAAAIDGVVKRPVITAAAAAAISLVLVEVPFT